MSFRDELKSDFEASNTGFAIGGGRNIGVFENGEGHGPLNNRNTWLTEETGWANFLGIRRDPIEFLEGDEIEIGGINLKDINRDLEQEGNGDLTVLGSAAFQNTLAGYQNPDRKTADYWDAGKERNEQLLDAGMKLVNPLHTSEIAKKKPLQYELFEDDPGGVLPFQTFNEDMEAEEALGAFQDRFEEYGEDAVYVIKPENSSGGKGIKFFTYSEAVDVLENSGPPIVETDDEVTRYMFQLAMPVVADARIISYGDTPVTGMIRASKNGGICNMAQAEGDNYPEKTHNAIEHGIVYPMDIEEIEGSVFQEMTEDYAAAMKEAVDIDFDNAEIFEGWDFLLVDLDDDRLERYPDDVLDDIILYETDDGHGAFYGEVNASPGYGVDFVNADRPYQNSGANLLVGGDSTSRGRDFHRLTPETLHPEDREKIGETFRQL